MPATSTAPAVAAPDRLHRWGYHPAQSAQLGQGYTATLWTARAPSTSDEALDMNTLTPIVELTRDGRAVQWWTPPAGVRAISWLGDLTCLATGAEANCVLTGGTGAHSGYVVGTTLRDGRLTSGSHAWVVSDSADDVAADLNRDGYLDAALVDSDYDPNYATGHQFWMTLRYTGDVFIRTGCVARPSHGPAPRAFVHGACPIP